MRLKIKDLKKGDVFYECAEGRNFRGVATEDARRVTSDDLHKYAGWECLADFDGEIIPLYVADLHEHYGPSLYTEKAYHEPEDVESEVIRFDSRGATQMSEEPIKLLVTDADDAKYWHAEYERERNEKIRVATESAELINTLRAQRDAAVATEQNIREVNNQLQSKLDCLPADWMEDSSLETWFPFTARRVKKMERQIADLKAAITRRDEFISSQAKAALTYSLPNLSVTYIDPVQYVTAHARLLEGSIQRCEASRKASIAQLDEVISRLQSENAALKKRNEELESEFVKSGVAIKEG